MRYGPFGEPDSASVAVRLRYTGQWFDPEPQLYYYKARWYSPWLGRFLSPDPAGDADGPNLYAYVGNDPVNLSDPTGMFGEASGGLPTQNWDAGRTNSNATGFGVQGRGVQLAFLDAQALRSAGALAGRGALAAASTATGVAGALLYPTSTGDDTMTGTLRDGNYVYRSLRDGEAASLDTGLVAKNPSANYTPETHVSKGSRLKTQYISITKDLAVALKRSEGYGIVAIDLDQVPSVPGRRVIDVSNGFPSGVQPASNFARASKEVLIERYVPPAAVFLFIPPGR